MAVFQFTINDSFLTGAGHPITVPKSQLPYKELIAAGLDHKHVTVILPHGERFEAEIYFGEAGYGEYYQIRFIGQDRTLPGYLKSNDQVFVLLTMIGSRSYAIIERRE
jgi:hypothetical protein